MGFKERASKLKTEIPAIFLAMKQKETPFAAKILIGITIAYALSPIDLIPDFIPVLGYLDDLIILPILASLAIKLIPDHIMAQCRRQAAGLWENGKPKKWYYALPIVLLWLILLWVLIRIIFI